MESSEYKKQVSAFFTQRKNTYDNDLTYRRAIKLVELTPLKTGQKLLDVATGTGIVAIAGAEKVSSNGKVIGVDISVGMLERAKEKIEAAKIDNIELIHGDAEHLNFRDCSFDAIICSSSLVWLSSIDVALLNWHRWLKKGGIVSFSCYSDTSFFTPILAGICDRLYGISLPNWNEPLGTPQKCRQLLYRTGFQNIDIKIEQFGSYLTVDEAKNQWQGNRVWINPRGNPLSQLSNKQLNKLKAAYDAEIENLSTNKGFWHDITTFFVLAHKQKC